MACTVLESYSCAMSTFFPFVPSYWGSAGLARGPDTTTSSCHRTVRSRLSADPPLLASMMRVQNTAVFSTPFPGYEQTSP